jgi:hypothetical protein
MYLSRGKTRDNHRQPSSNDEFGYRRPLKPLCIHFDLRKIGFLAKQKPRFMPGLLKRLGLTTSTHNCAQSSCRRLQ